MNRILRQYMDDDGLQVTEYTRDGETVSAIIRQPIPVDLEEPNPTQPVEPAPAETIEEKLERIDATTAYNQLQTEYLVILAEFNAM